jgi:hypothetical protein
MNTSFNFIITNALLKSQITRIEKVLFCKHIPTLPIIKVFIKKNCINFSSKTCEIVLSECQIRSSDILINSDSFRSVSISKVFDLFDKFIEDWLLVFIPFELIAKCTDERSSEKVHDFVKSTLEPDHQQS